MTLTFKIWLDDVRPPPNWDTEAGDADPYIGWLWFMQVQHAIFSIEYHLSRGSEWTDISLDHDLGDGHDGIELVNWMRENDIWPTNRPLIHSMNPVGRKNMEFVIAQKYDCEIPL
jgi:hypothetical protein